MRRNISLIGFQGSGKTTGGQIVAERLNWAFIDLDEEVTRSQGRPIHAIRRRYGVSYYRQLEGGLLERIRRSERQVVASGAGTVASEHNWELMRKNGFAVCLEVSAETTLARLSQKYPDGLWIAQGPDPIRQIQTRKDERQPKYELAGSTVQTDDLDPIKVAEAVIRLANAHLTWS